MACDLLKFDPCGFVDKANHGARGSGRERCQQCLEWDGRCSEGLSKPARTDPASHQRRINPHLRRAGGYRGFEVRHRSGAGEDRRGYESLIHL